MSKEQQFEEFEESFLNRVMDAVDHGSEHMATCPFNALHLVKRSRLQGHIVKCQKNFPNYVTCPYNASHRCPENQMKDHFEKCPNKPNTDIPVDDTSPEHSVRSDKSSVCMPSLAKSSSFLGSVESEVIQRPIGLYKPAYRRPLRETDPNHECWDD